MSKFTIPTVFKAVDNLSGPLQRMSANMDKFDKSARGIFGNLSEMQKDLFAFAGKAAILTGIGTVFTLATDSVLEYEKALHSLEAVTGQSYKLFQKQIEGIAVTSRKSAIDVAKSFEVVGSAMSEYLDNPKALGLITQAGITLSKASRMDLEPSLQALTSVMNQFGISADKAANVVNRLTAGEIVGSISTAKAAEHLQEFGAVAAANNVSLSESVALVEALGKKLPTETLGRASRNIITFMGAIKGAPKQALDALAKHGVNLGIVSDKTKTFGDRLRELSKIQGDAVAMEAFFGRENIAAGTTIFQQLGLYEDWAKKIAVTNQAQMQAATNSNTMSNALMELKNSFVNTIVTGEKLNAPLELMKSIFFVLAKNMDLVVGTITALVGAFLLYKVAVLGVNAALMLSNGIMNTLFLVDMVKYIAATRGLTFASAAMAVVQSSLNALWLANPVGVVIAGVVALTAVVWGLNKALSKGNAQEQATEALRERTLENTINQRAEATALFQALRTAAQGSKAYNEALKKLEQIQPGITDQYGLQLKAIDKINEAEKQLISTIMKRAQAEAQAEIVREKARAKLQAYDVMMGQGNILTKAQEAIGMRPRYDDYMAKSAELEAAATLQQALNVEAETKSSSKEKIDLYVRDPNNRVDTTVSKGINISKPDTTSTIGQQ